ncbi:hypothetical protein IAR55_000162 [Kwoniella newhampshirensis]|uniref:BTB domain-containing protein n=1 Tax=Kwoniella newhampshirensis TaxID=1651941 RepID=A0AAW0Z6G2_9TREE
MRIVSPPHPHPHPHRHHRHSSHFGILGPSPLSQTHFLDLDNDDERGAIRRLATVAEEIVTPLNGRFQDERADLILVSNDGLRFRVDSSKLAKASPVLENLVTMTMTMSFDVGDIDVFDTNSSSGSSSNTSHGPNSTSSPISTSSSPTSTSSSTSSSASQSEPPSLSLTKSHESSTTVSLFLHLLYSHPLPTPPSPASFCIYETLLVFLNSYECAKSLYDDFGRWATRWVQEGRISASKGFLVGCQIGCEGLCEESVRRSNDWTWRGGAGTGSGHISIDNSTARSPQFNIVKDGIFPAPSLDLSAVPYDYFCSLPKQHKFALLRATRNVNTSMGFAVELDGGFDWDKVAEEYKRILEEISKSQL